MESYIDMKVPLRHQGEIDRKKNVVRIEQAKQMCYSQNPSRLSRRKHLCHKNRELQKRFLRSLYKVDT